MIVLGTHETAVELLEKRSSIYSDRSMTSTAELYVCSPMAFASTSLLSRFELQGWFRLAHRLDALRSSLAKAEGSVSPVHESQCDRAVSPHPGERD